MRLHFALLLPLLTSACIASNPSGIWMIQYTPSAESECSFECDANFDDHDCLESDDGGGDSDWEITETHDSSDGIYFVQIETTTANAGVLFIGTETYPGTNAGGTWTFMWERYDNSEVESEHEDGYVYSEALEDSANVTFTLEAKSAAGTGSVSADTLSVLTYVESDEWDEDDNDIFSGVIPASSYLEDDDGDVAVNMPDEQECGDDECEIKLTTACDASNDFTATLTDFADEDAFEYVMGSGQGSGN